MKRILPELKKAKDDEIVNFALRCSAMGLNPLIDVHNVSFGDTDVLTPIIKKDYYLQNAQLKEDFRGFKAGVVVATEKGEIIEREGTIVAPSEELLGGWAKVFTENRGEYYSSASIEEYQMKKIDGSVNKMWRSKPATMIRKVALSQALRDAYPIYSGTYSEEEILTNNNEEYKDAQFEDVTKQKVLIEATEGNRANIEKKEKKSEILDPEDLFN
jgi:phage recombination protein Bet